jgi:hypothetical protein
MLAVVVADVEGEREYQFERRFPILRSGFHHYFLHLLLHEPFR